ncbi:unnamed protein product [Discula destructiva]
MDHSKYAALLQHVHESGYIEVPKTVHNLPRRRPRSQREDAQKIAEIMFPNYHPEKAIIHYEEQRRRAVAARTASDLAKLEEQKRRFDNGRPDKQRGAWDPATDPVELPKALPMPVGIGPREEFSDCFAFLRSDQGERVEVLLNMPDPASLNPTLGVTVGKEPIYESRLLEFKRGVVYEDGRLDLCKMVVGPDHIDELMDSLEANGHIRHFLLGNNVITNHGARRIAGFIKDHPGRMRTWYLAGNHIKAAGFDALAQAFEGSDVLEQLWLKRNPLGPTCAEKIVRIFETTKRLQILDVENCELGDAGVADLFDGLAKTPNFLETIYINGNGISITGCTAIARFLASPHCRLQYLMMSSNPIGDAGAAALATGIGSNSTLEVVTVASCGLSSRGVSALCAVLAQHPRIRHVDLGSRFSTADLGQRFNYITDEAIESIKALASNPSLRFLELGFVALSETGLELVRDEVVASSSLVGFEATRIIPAEDMGEAGGRNCSLRVRDALEKNYMRFYGGVGQMADGVPYGKFISMSGPSRLLRNSPGVRLIDSVYRTRDKGNMASGKSRKFWDLEYEKERELWERLNQIE